ncbi:hypothetical protein PIB30_037879 [Stylosanthes scabra]|uniref:Transmembrane protein n=1 Tax=Stylosanthes scabra TaxID=79078 RepID=A0ABU6YCM3_9FABA|nr:hypothetical protein [Stylosanthes scabra]
MTSTTATPCMKLAEHKNHANQVSLEDSDDHQHGSLRGIYSVSLHDHLFPSNVWLAFWLCLVACSYFLLSIYVLFFGNWKVNSAERPNPNARKDKNDDEIGLNSVFGSSDERSQSPQTVSSDLKPFSTYEDPSTPLSLSFSGISDFHGTSYLDSLLSLEEEDSEWLSDLKPVKCSSEDSWSSFCSSPRKKHVFDSGSITSSLTKILFNEDDLNACSNKDLFGMDLCGWDEEISIETVVGLKEFDGHEGLDPEFNCDAFLLYESLIC